MLRSQSLPASWAQLLDAFQSCFTHRGFATFQALATGFVAAPARRTVCGMLTSGRMALVWHHSRAHRFFATARWSVDEVGLTVLRLVIGWLVPFDAPVMVAVDDTLFRRSGRKVHAASWSYDGSRHVAAGQYKLSYGTTFVVAAVVVCLPFLHRPIALPVLARLWRTGGPTKTALARDMITMIAAARPDRRFHVIADSAYICTELRRLPTTVTLTGPPPRNAALWEVHPDVDHSPCLRGRRGRPRVRGEKIGTPHQLATLTKPRTVTVTRYGRTNNVTVWDQRCLWYGVFRSRPVRMLLIRDDRRRELALTTTDPHTPTAGIIERYAARWAIEVAFADAKHTTGVGEAHNRTPLAVQRTVPFGLFTHTLVVIWYSLSGHSPRVVTEHRQRARWYTTKTHPSVADMLTTLRRVLIAAEFRADPTNPPTPEQIHTIRLAWENATA